MITAKLLAENDNPQADVIWKLAATSLLLFKSEGMLEAYSPAGPDKLDPKFVDKSTPPSWVGMVEHFPAGLEEAMIKNDFEFAANNRAAILERWQAQHDGKSDPKG